MNIEIDIETLNTLTSAALHHATKYLLESHELHADSEAFKHSMRMYEFYRDAHKVSADLIRKASSIRIAEVTEIERPIWPKSARLG